MHAETPSSYSFQNGRFGIPSMSHTLLNIPSSLLFLFRTLNSDSSFIINLSVSPASFPFTRPLMVPELEVFLFLFLFLFRYTFPLWVLRVLGFYAATEGYRDKDPHRL